MAGKITQDLMPLILKMSGEGKHSEDICAFLKKHFDVEVAAITIRKRLAKVSSERGQMIQATLVNRLVDTVTGDLNEVQGIIDRALEDERHARNVVYGMTLTTGPDGKVVATQSPVLAVGTQEYASAMHVVKGCRGDVREAVALRLKMAGAIKEDPKNRKSAGVIALPPMDPEDGDEPLPGEPPPLPLGADGSNHTVN